MTMKTKSKNVKKAKTTRVTNPQPILEAKKALVKKAKGRLTFEGRRWTVKTPKVEKVLTSAQMAGFNLKGFAKAFRLPLQA
jgi:hypothetical protein